MPRKLLSPRQKGPFRGLWSNLLISELGTLRPRGHVCSRSPSDSEGGPKASTIKPSQLPHLECSPRTCKSDRHLVLPDRSGSDLGKPLHSSECHFPVKMEIIIPTSQYHREAIMLVINNLSAPFRMKLHAYIYLFIHTNIS